MRKVIFFTDPQHVSQALDYFNMQEFSEKQVPVKLHMGEIKNKHFPRPAFVKTVITELKQRKIQPYLLDTTVAYPGLRHSKTGYKKVARLHGFSVKKIGCPVVIDDTGITQHIEQRDYDVAEHLFHASSIFAISHVKGHIATGMGGAIKNFGMGGVTKETKKRMHHGCRPVYNKDACTYCGVCAEVCPFNALQVKHSTWKQNLRSCFGCGVCVNLCEHKALTFQDVDLQYTLACAVKACVHEKNVLYLNDVNRIAKSCDCDPFADPIICPDIGYLLSDDPVAVDKASLDLIHNVKEDVFLQETNIDPMKQIKYGEEIGLGSASYQLIEI